jgi:hypothetical protein
LRFASPVSAPAKVASRDATKPNEKGNDHERHHQHQPDCRVKRPPPQGDRQQRPGRHQKEGYTSGNRDLGLIATVEIAERVAALDSFTEDNDPHGEHDFGSFDHDGNRIFWKIDYYDRASFGTRRDMGSGTRAIPHAAHDAGDYGYAGRTRIKPSPPEFANLKTSATNIHR